MPGMWEHLPVPLVQRPVRQEHCATGQGRLGTGSGETALQVHGDRVSQLRKSHPGPPHPNRFLRSRPCHPSPTKHRLRAVVGLAEISSSRSCPLTLHSLHCALIFWTSPCRQQHGDLPCEAHSLRGGNRLWNGNQQTLTGRGRAASRTRGLWTLGPQGQNMESLWQVGDRGRDS